MGDQLLDESEDQIGTNDGCKSLMGQHSMSYMIIATYSNRYADYCHIISYYEFHGYKML